MCYSQEVFDEIIADSNRMKIALDIGKILQDKNEVDYENNGAGVTFALVKLNLHEPFLSLLNEKYQGAI